MQFLGPLELFTQTEPARPAAPLRSQVPVSLRNDCSRELAPQSAAAFPATETVSYTYASTFQSLLAQINEVAQGISLGYALSDTKQH